MSFTVGHLVKIQTLDISNHQPTTLWLDSNVPGFLFMDWLGHITRAPVPKSIERFDKDFHKLIVSRYRI